MVASDPMKIRATVFVIAKLSAIAATTGLAACGAAQGKLRVDSPAIPYQAPDISEITGIEEPDEGEGSGSAEPGK